MLCFACGLYLGWAAGQMFGRGALLSLTSVLNATSDEPALTTGDTIQPHSLFDLLKPLQTPTPAFWTLTFVLLDFFFLLFHIHHSLALFLPPLSFLFGCEERSISLHDAGYQFFRSLSSWWHLAWLLYARQEMSWWWMKANCSLDPPFLHQALFASALSA